MRRYVQLFSLAFVTWSASACTPVLVKHPIGEPVSEDAEELAGKFDGVWQIGDGALQLKYVPDGKLQVAEVRWDDNKQQFNIKQNTVLLTTHQDSQYMNGAQSPGEEETEYQFVRYTFAEDDILVFWLPRVAAFEEAIEEKKLQGTIESNIPESSKTEDDSTIRLRTNTIRVTATKDELLQFIRDERFGEQFEVDSPYVLRKLGTKK